MPRTMRLGTRLVRWGLGPICALAAACAAENRQQQQVVRAREQINALRRYDVPKNYREQLEAYFGAAVADAGTGGLMMTAPSGAIVCGHLKPSTPGPAHAGYLPFGAIFDRAGSLKWVRVFQPYQGMYVAGAPNVPPTDDDVAIAMACEIPLVF